MIGRIIAAMAFLAGGAVTFFVIAVLSGFGASQAAMSAGPVPAKSGAEALIPWLAGSYFVVSAIGILLCRRRGPLRVAALVAHSLLLITFLSICAGAGGSDSEHFWAGFLMLSVTTVLYFSPWFIIWAVFLLKAGSPAQPGAPPNGDPTSPPADPGASDRPPSGS
jgi:hypothetical protein